MHESSSTIGGTGLQLRSVSTITTLAWTVKWLTDPDRNIESIYMYSISHS